MEVITESFKLWNSYMRNSKFQIKNVICIHTQKLMLSVIIGTVTKADLLVNVGRNSLHSSLPSKCFPAAEVCAQKHDTLQFILSPKEKPCSVEAQEECHQSGASWNFRWMGRTAKKTESHVISRAIPTISRVWVMTLQQTEPLHLSGCSKKKKEMRISDSV